MKKFLLTLMLCMLTMALQAQIQRKFFELELGKSTYQEVKDYVKKQHWALLKKKKDFMYIIPGSPKHLIIFGGVKWNEMIFNFDNGILSLITFKYEGRGPSPIYGYNENSAHLLEVNDLKRRINEKYHSYFVNENKREENSEEYFYRDGSTSLQITSSIAYTVKLELTYKDDTKSADRIKKENDEL